MVAPLAIAFSLVTVSGRPAYSQRVADAPVAFVRPATADQADPDAARRPRTARADRRTVLRSALVGGVVGGVIAAAGTFLVIESSDRDFGIDGIYYSIFIPIGVGVGALVGAIVGAAR